MSDTPEDRPDDSPDEVPSADRHRTVRQGGMTPKEEAAATGAAAAAGIGCLSAAFIPYLTVIGAAIVLLTLGFFLKGGCAPSSPPGSPADPSAPMNAPVDSPTHGPPGR